MLPVETHCDDDDDDDGDGDGDGDDDGDSGDDDDDDDNDNDCGARRVIHNLDDTWCSERLTQSLPLSWIWSKGD